MVRIGICGSSGAGKSTICKIFQGHGFAWLNCDDIYHRLVSDPSECLTAIGARFGKELIRENKLDRIMLRDIVFSDPLLSAELGRITHPYVIAELKREAEELSNRGCIGCLIDAPMLFESALDSYCDLVIGVVADKSLKADRLIQRDSITEEQALRRWQNQLADEELRDRCDVIVENNGTVEELETKCIVLIQRIARDFKLDLS